MDYRDWLKCYLSLKLPARWTTGMTLARFLNNRRYHSISALDQGASLH
jgi:hypothetical protein